MWACYHDLIVINHTNKEVHTHFNPTQYKETASKYDFSKIVPFAEDTQGNVCSGSILFLKAIAKLEFKNLPGDKRFKDRAQADWVSESCKGLYSRSRLLKLVVLSIIVFKNIKFIITY